MELSISSFSVHCRTGFEGDMKNHGGIEKSIIPTSIEKSIKATSIEKSIKEKRMKQQDTRPG